jgi:hypothetical protein
MFIDAEQSFVTVTNGVLVPSDVTAADPLDNVIDLGVANHDIGVGEPMAVVINVTTAASLTTCQFDVEVDDDAARGSAVVIARRIMANADLTLGTRIVIPVGFPAGTDARYMGVRVTPTGGAATISVTAFLQPMSMIQADRYYPDNVTIS